MSEFREKMDAYKKQVSISNDEMLRLAAISKDVVTSAEKLADKVEVITTISEVWLGYCSQEVMSSQSWYDAFVESWKSDEFEPSLRMSHNLSVSSIAKHLPAEGLSFLAGKTFNWIANPTYDPAATIW